MRQEQKQATAETMVNAVTTLIMGNIATITADLQETLNRDGGLVKLPVKIEINMLYDENEEVTVDPKIEWKVEQKRKDALGAVLVDMSGMEQMELLDES